MKNLRIPAEWEPHECCWMAWAVHDEWKDWGDKVKDELETVIKTVAQFEPVGAIMASLALQGAWLVMKQSLTELRQDALAPAE